MYSYRDKSADRYDLYNDDTQTVTAAYIFLYFGPVLQDLATLQDSNVASGLIDNSLTYYKLTVYQFIY